MRRFLLIAMLAACGGDEGDGGGPPPPAKAGPAGANAPVAAPVVAAPIVKPPGSKLKVEDRVTAEEESGIRHVFANRDFITDDNNRDPFQSFVLAQPGLNSGEALQREVTRKCLRDDQFVATSYSYTDLSLVGIVTERTQKRVLMMDSSNFGHLIKKGDCVGREKAVVKDIGAGYVTFQVEPEENGNGQTRQVEEHSVQLYPNQLPLSSQPSMTPAQPKQVAPVVKPDGTPVQSPSTSAPPVTSPSSPSSPMPPVVAPK